MTNDVMVSKLTAVRGMFFAQTIPAWLMCELCLLVSCLPTRIKLAQGRVRVSYGTASMERDARILACGEVSSDNNVLTSTVTYAISVLESRLYSGLQSACCDHGCSTSTSMGAGSM